MNKRASLRLCYIADVRSPTFRNWVKHFVAAGHEVRAISTYPCAPDCLPGVEITAVPNIFSQFSGISHDGAIGARHRSVISPLLATVRSGFVAEWVRATRYWLGPLELRRHVGKVQSLIAEFEPDIVHAMRVPFEGMLAGLAVPSDVPLLLSIWGNDFTLHSRATPLMKQLARRALTRADALHPDCSRDLRLAQQFGFSTDKMSIILPGAGGIQADVFNHGAGNPQLREQLGIAQGAPVLINPRGFRIGSVCNDVFFQAIPAVLERQPDAVFVCNSMAGNSVVEGWVEELGIGSSVRLLPTVARDKMAELFRLADITVSPSIHDGTPNSLLEAMACGCFPVAGDIESVREWITDDENGLLCDATDAESQAAAMIRALEDASLRERAKRINLELISERAEYNAVMRRAEAFYYEVIESHQTGKARNLLT